MIEELINKMKLCPFCRDSEEYPYMEIDAQLHQMFGKHKILNKTWSPAKGHTEFETHVKTIKILGLCRPY